MSLGERLLNLRKDKRLSQEEVADKLNVTRQTVSKWETDQSMPDFDKIAPLCKLYNITPNELFGEANEKEKTKNEYNKDANSIAMRRKAKGIAVSILVYFIAIVWIMISIPTIDMDPIIATSIFLLICAVATAIIVYVSMIYKKEKTKVESKEDKLKHQISEIVAVIITIIYLTISFITMAWHLTWIIWIIYGLFNRILNLIFMLRSNNNEK